MHGKQLLCQHRVDIDLIDIRDILKKLTEEGIGNAYNHYRKIVQQLL